MDSISKAWGVDTEKPQEEQWIISSRWIEIKKGEVGKRYAAVEFTGFSEEFNADVWTLELRSREGVFQKYEISIRDKTLILNEQCDDCSTYYFRRIP